MRRTTLFVLLVFLSVSVVTCLVQNQEYVGQYDAYFGFAYLTTPNMNLAERGWQGQFGYNYRRWLALGFDTSYFGGSSSLTVQQLKLCDDWQTGADAAASATWLYGLGALSCEYLHDYRRPTV